jgi:hypothetical protein
MSETILVAWDGEVEIESAHFATHLTIRAASVGTPPLKSYTLTHLPSGRALAYSDDRAALKALVRRIDPLAAWDSLIYGDSTPDGFREARDEIVGPGAQWPSHSGPGLSVHS